MNATIVDDMNIVEIVDNEGDIIELLGLVKRALLGLGYSETLVDEYITY